MGLTTYDDEFLLAAIVIISMALIFYSVGVWSERIQGRLKGWHVTAFGLGLVCDFVGTALWQSWYGLPVRTTVYMLF